MQRTASGQFRSFQLSVEAPGHSAAGLAASAVPLHFDALAPETAEAVLDAAVTAPPCGLQLLGGLPPDRPVAVARRAGVPVRAYVPYGHGYLPYALSTLERDPKLLLRVAQGLRRRTWP